MRISKELWALPARSAHKYSTQNKNGNRSPHRTKILNSEFISLLKNYFDPEQWDFETEVAIPCSRGGSFKIDVCARNKANPRVNHWFLLKAVESNYNKNSHNYGNCHVGETTRIFTVEEKYTDCSLNFVDWVPWEVPSPTSKNPNRMEAPRPCEQGSEFRFLQEVINSAGHKNCFVTSSKIRYNLGNSSGDIDGWQTLSKALERINAK